MTDIDIKKLIEDGEKLYLSIHHLNGWDGSHNDQEKRNEYYRKWAEFNEAKIKELHIEEYLGKESFAELRFVLDNRKEALIMDFLATPPNEVSDDNIHSIKTKEETILEIKNSKQLIEFKKDAYYCCFRFKTTIKERFYAGNFIKHHEGMTAEEGVELMEEIQGGDEGFMPELSKKIEEFIGEDNFISDFYEFGNKDFGLYWFINKDVFESVIDKTLSWMRYEELDNYFMFIGFHSDTVLYTQYDLNKKTIPIHTN